MGPHTTSDDPTRYRAAGGGRATGRPSIRSRATARTCETSGCGPSGSRSGSQRGPQRLRTELRDAVVDSRDIDVAEMFDTVYHDITPDLARATRPTAGRTGEGGVT